MMLAKWLSIDDHIHNVHDDHASDLFPKCTKASEKLSSLLTNKRLQSDVKKLSPLHQTSNVEAYHSLNLHFCLKNTHYSYMGIKCRLILAALHYNENSSRSQAKTKTGEDSYTIVFPKFKNKDGGYSIQKKKVPATYAYASKLMETLCDETVREPQKFAEVQKNVNIPPPLASQFDHPDREEAVSKLLKRFNLP
ncbi:hypothetical protein GWK47_051738 [Chionoecetes opilio]|uniref:Uncharacterized protein n=1 Tax=Chionoecetes opilio TaxID=41210 RepID=A0A8J4Y1W9_CHIOP|nr:hypothetical protein GWK47_051738 [Chionoecetes opilio]